MFDAKRTATAALAVALCGCGSTKGSTDDASGDALAQDATDLEPCKVDPANMTLERYRFFDTPSGTSPRRATHRRYIKSGACEAWIFYYHDPKCLPNNMHDPTCVGAVREAAYTNCPKTCDPWENPQRCITSLGGYYITESLGPADDYLNECICCVRGVCEEYCAEDATQCTLGNTFPSDEDCDCTQEFGELPEQ